MRLTDVVPTVGLSTDVFSSSVSSADLSQGSLSTRRSLLEVDDPWQKHVCVHTLKIYLEMVLKSSPITAKSQRTMVSGCGLLVTDIIIVALIVLFSCSLTSVRQSVFFE